MFHLLCKTLYFSIDFPIFTSSFKILVCNFYRKDQPSRADQEAGQHIAGVVHAKIDPAHTDQKHQDTDDAGKQVPAPVPAVPVRR